jgi:hypothetical protein
MPGKDRKQRKVSVLERESARGRVVRPSAGRTTGSRLGTGHYGLCAMLMLFGVGKRTLGHITMHP